MCHINVPAINNAGTYFSSNHLLPNPPYDKLSTLDKKNYMLEYPFKSV